MERRPHLESFFFAQKPHVVTVFHGCVEECWVVPPWTKASERYVSFFNQEEGTRIFGRLNFRIPRNFGPPHLHVSGGFEDLRSKIYSYSMTCKWVEGYSEVAPFGLNLAVLNSVSVQKKFGFSVWLFISVCLDRDIRFSRTQTSAVSEHDKETGHIPIWSKVKIIDRDPHWYTSRVKEAIHMRLHPNNINRDSGIDIPEAWIPTIKQHNSRFMRTYEGTPSNNRNNDEYRNAPIATHQRATNSDT